MAKLLVVMAMTAASSALLLCWVVATGAALPWLQSLAKFDTPVPVAVILREGAQVTGLMFLALSIQHWVSLRWRSFPVAIGFGIVAVAISFAMIASIRDQGGWTQYFPWALPMLVLAKRPQNIEAALWIGGAMGLVVTAAGCAEFSRRGVK